MKPELTQRVATTEERAEDLVHIDRTSSVEMETAERRSRTVSCEGIHARHKRKAASVMKRTDICKGECCVTLLTMSTQETLSWMAKKRLALLFKCRDVAFVPSHLRATLEAKQVWAELDDFFDGGRCALRADLQPCYLAGEGQEARQRVDAKIVQDERREVRSWSSACPIAGGTGCSASHDTVSRRGIFCEH